MLLPREPLDFGVFGTGQHGVSHDADLDQRMPGHPEGDALVACNENRSDAACIGNDGFDIAYPQLSRHRQSSPCDSVTWDNDRNVTEQGECGTHPMARPLPSESSSSIITPAKG